MTHPTKQRRLGATAPLQGAILSRAVELDLVTPGAAIDWDRRDAEVAAARRASETAANRERDRRRAKDLEDAGFPLRAIRAAANPAATPAMDAVRSWRPTAESNVLVLLGGAGAGKTVAATWWAMQRPHVPVFERASSFAATSRYDRESRDRVLRASSLVLDDLGAEFADAKGSFLTDLDELLDVFYGHGRPLLITSNLVNIDEVAKRYKSRVASRLEECGTIWSCGGVSQRKAPGGAA